MKIGEEEKKAIEVLKNKKIYECLTVSGRTSLDIVLNLIEKQNKELEDYKSRKIYEAHLIEIASKNKEISELKEYIKNNLNIAENISLKQESELKDKMIDEAIDLIVRKTGSRIEICHNMNCDKTIEKECKKCALEYFRKKVENDDK